MVLFYNWIRWKINISIQACILLKFAKKEKLVIIFVPGRNLPGGGVLSLMSLYIESKNILSSCSTNVFLCNINGTGNNLKQSWFKNRNIIYSELSLVNHIKYSTNIILHIPELYLRNFIDSHNLLKLSKEKVLLNVYNQNNLMMPSVEIFDRLKLIYKRLTISVNFTADLSDEMRNKYGVPVHYIPSWLVDTHYELINILDKRRTILISNDPHPLKEQIVKLLKIKFPYFKIIIIKKIDYFDFLEIQKYTKYSISFGEGFDGYFVGTSLFGGICFTVYNQVFFPSSISEISHNYVYSSYEELASRISGDIEKLELDPEFYSQYSKSLIPLLEKEFSYSAHLEGIRNFYNNKFTII